MKWRSDFKPLHKNPLWKYVFPIIILWVLIIPLIEIVIDFINCGVLKC